MCHATMTWEEHSRQRKQQMQERTFAICAISFPCKEGNFAICDHMDLEGIMLTMSLRQRDAVDRALETWTLLCTLGDH